MAFLIKAVGAKIKFDQSFFLAADRITINGEVVLHGRLKDAKPQRFKIRTREYEICRTLVNLVPRRQRAIDIRIYERGRPVFIGLYDDQGRQIQSHDELDTKSGTYLFTLFGAILGCVLLVVLVLRSGDVAFGYLASFVGAIGGGEIGYSLGKAIFGGR